ncbi:MAG: hypothetical protein H6597_03965 [Flavobacteriales bacterium]|nr:hypothetical protein [Flavobacteriales bacterium]MCB9193666.1 hypothetical protein [Flavobacteriales bacterium]
MIHRKTLAILFGALLIVSCRNDPTESGPYQQLKEDMAHLEQTDRTKDSTINDLFGSFNRITENLRLIREKQSGLGKRADGVENDKDMEQHVMDDLHAIDSLLEANRSMIARLKKDAKANGGRIVELQRTVSELEQQVSEKDSEIGTLKEQLASTNSSLATLIEMYRDKEQQADLQRDELNTAYYAVGSSKELRDNGVLTKEGGFIGIGKVAKLNTTALNARYFKQIDIKEVTRIPVMAKKAELITSHPEGSYHFEGSVEALVITDPEAFWSLSKYLVVVVEE